MDQLKTTPTLVSPRLAKFFDDYSSYHKTQGNKISHFIGIPFIVASLLGLLSNLSLSPPGWDFSPYLRLDGGTTLIALALIFYLYLDWKITVPFSLFVGGLYFLGRAIPTPINWGLFVIGWILQGIGHAVFEKNSPAFFKNFTHLLIGPLWIFSKLVGYA